MNIGLLACTFALSAALLPATAAAEDRRSAETRARDSATIKRLNQQQLAYVRQRDAKNQRTHRHADSDQAEYDNARAEYARKMASWRRAVAACNAGQWEYCDK